MINTLNIGKYIYTTLQQSEDITCKVYPLVADNDAKYPFIIYKRVNLLSSDVKDGIIQDDVTIEIVVVSDKYSVGVDIATKVRELLEKEHVTFQEMEIDDCKIVLATEEFNNAFVQRMQFNFKVNN
jgi:hypothetical protein